MRRVSHAAGWAPTACLAEVGVVGKMSLSSVPVKSYEPLKKSTLEELIIDPFDLKTLRPVLKGMKHLKTINKIPAADLLK